MLAKKSNRIEFKQFFETFRGTHCPSCIRNTYLFKTAAQCGKCMRRQYNGEKLKKSAFNRVELSAPAIFEHNLNTVI